MDLAGAISHIRAASAAHRKDPANSPFDIEDDHVIQRMSERGISIDDIAEICRSPTPQTVRESVNGPDRWEVRGKTLEGDKAMVVLLPKKRPNTLVITVIDG